MMDLRSLRDDLERMIEATEHNLEAAYKAYPKGEKAPYIDDDVVNDLETKLDKECLSFLLKERPFAGDLRTLTGIYKLISDLERISDHAYDVSWVIGHLHEEKGFEELPEAKALLAKSFAMFMDAVKALREENLLLAEKVLSEDDAIDELYLKALDSLGKRKKEAGQERQDLYTLLLAKYAERVADHSSNIAEWVIYMGTGVYKGSKIL